MSNIPIPNRKNFHIESYLLKCRAWWNLNALALDLGCGMRKEEGEEGENVIGIDIIEYPGVNLVWDLNNGIPFSDNLIQVVYSHDFIEHVEDPIFMMREIWRVLKPNGRFKLVVPSTTGNGAFQDLTHKSFWNLGSFGYWRDSSEWADSYRGPCLFEIPFLNETREGDVTHIFAEMRPIKTKGWLDQYRERHPEDFVEIEKLIL